MGKWCLHASSFIFDRIIIEVVGNQDRHKSSVKFDFGPNQTTHFGVPFHRLEMTEILLKGRKTLTHPSIILELLAMEWQKFHTFELEYL